MTKGFLDYFVYNIENGGLFVFLMAFARLPRMYGPNLLPMFLLSSTKMCNFEA